MLADLGRGPRQPALDLNQPHSHRWPQRNVVSRPLPRVAARWRRPRAQHLAQQHDLTEMVRVVRGHVLDRIADGVPGERWVFDRRTDRSGGIAVAKRGGTFQPSREARADGVPRSRRRRGPPERCAGRRRICRAVTSTAEPFLPEREVRHDFGDGMRGGGDAPIRVVALTTRLGREAPECAHGC